MNSRLRTVLLFWNFLAIVIFTLGLLYAWLQLPLGGAPNKITTLDRAGVIDEAKLQEAFPSLAQNLRHDLGMWVAEGERHALFQTLYVAIAIFTVNCIILLFVRTKPVQV